VPYVHLSQYYEQYGRKEPKTQTHNPFTFANGHPEKQVWEIMHSNPQRMKDFMQSMHTLEQHLPITGFYDFAWLAETAAADPERVLFVDVGGGKGQAIKAIARENPFIPLTRCVLQDRPDTLEEVKAIDDEGIRGAVLQVHNFHTEQPVKGMLLSIPFVPISPPAIGVFFLLTDMILSHFFFRSGPVLDPPLSA
jgi:hypothetical protein